MSHTYQYLYYFLFSFQSSDSKPILFASTAYPRFSSRKWQRAISICLVCFITTVIQLRPCIVLIDLFYIINCVPEHNINRLSFYNRKEGKFICCFWAKLVPATWLILFFDPNKDVVWVIYTIIYIISHFRLQPSDSRPIFFAVTAYRHHSSRKWQRIIIVCLVCCITTVIQLQSYIVLIELFYIINYLLKHNINRFCC